MMASMLMGASTIIHESPGGECMYIVHCLDGRLDTSVIMDVSILTHTLMLMGASLPQQLYTNCLKANVCTLFAALMDASIPD